MSSSSSNLIDILRRSIQEERQAELAESQTLTAGLSIKTLQRAGLAIGQLQVSDCKSGLGGRLYLTLSCINHTEIPATRLSAGDIIQIRSGQDVLSDLSTLVRIQKTNIVVSVEQWSETSNLLSIVKTYSDVCYRRSIRCLDQISNLSDRCVQRLCSILLGDNQVQNLGPESASLSSLQELNAGQRQAVRDALRTDDLFLIHGPPGCGKTTTISHLIAESARSGQKVLVCAPSNIAVDCIVEQLSKFRLKVIRLGHPARILPSVLAFCLDEIISQSETYQLAQDVKTELRSLHKPKKSAGRPNAEHRQHIRSERRQLRADLRKLEKRMTEEILNRAQVICCTCIGADIDLIRHLIFDVGVIDEAGQGLESECWIPAIKCKKLILAGDHHQLPPTTKSSFTEKLPTMFQRMHETLSKIAPDHISTLTTQYRMNIKIQNWSSNKFYNGDLEPHESVNDHLLSDLPNVATTSDTCHPLIFIDTSYCDLDEEELDSNERFNQMSRGNPGEARIAVLHAIRLLRAGLRSDQIGILTPYNRQVDLCRQSLHDLSVDQDISNLEIGTVDGFQGREKEAIIVTCVRSNPDHEIGFLSDYRRMNVALTRARRHLCVIADSVTLSTDRHLADLVNYLQEHALYRSAALYEDPNVDFEDE